MFRPAFFAAAATAALSLAACENTDRQLAANNAQAVAASDEQAIRNNVDRWLEAVRARDAAAIAQLYTVDGHLMPQNMPAASGRDAIEKAWADLMAMPGFDLTFSPDEIVVSSSGDMALDRGTYRSGEERGKYVVVWRKVDGEWKAAADIFNSDGPAPAG